MIFQNPMKHILRNIRNHVKILKIRKIGIIMGFDMMFRKKYCEKKRKFQKNMFYICVDTYALNFNHLNHEKI